MLHRGTKERFVPVLAGTGERVEFVGKRLFAVLRRFPALSREKGGGHRQRRRFQPRFEALEAGNVIGFELKSAPPLGVQNLPFLVPRRACAKWRERRARKKAGCQTHRRATFREDLAVFVAGAWMGVVGRCARRKLGVSVGVCASRW